MIRPRYTLTETAAADLEAIWDFIAQDSEGAATRVFNEILDACDELGGQPGLGHAREDLSSGRPLLFWSVYNYLVVYRRDRTPIEVIAVVHGARDVETVLRVR